MNSLNWWMMTTKAFVDTNILFDALVFQKSNVFEWLASAYDTVFVHQTVLNELINPQDRREIEKLITDGVLKRFDPQTEFNEVELPLYQSYQETVQQDLKALNAFRRAHDLHEKFTSDLGEISMLATCLITGINIICSRDSDVIAVIQRNDYQVFDEEANVDRAITCDDVIDFCLKVAAARKATDKELKTFLKVALHGQKRLDHDKAELIRRLSLLHEQKE